MNITLCDLNPKLCAEWERQFSKAPNIEVKNCDIFQCGPFDAITSPSNSFGELSGGIDLAYRKHFGMKLQTDLQTAIKALPMRELLVGQSLVIPTNDEEIPWLIASPTMRVPLDVSSTSNTYLAFKSTLVAAHENNFKNIICPGLGTLTGNVSEVDAARQMFMAYQDFNDKFPRFPNSINEAYRSHLEIVGLYNIKKR